VILLDDCSTDSSREIIERYRGHEKIRHIEYNAANSGSTFKQWEKGIKIAQGEWIWIAESDDVAEPIFLEILMINEAAYISKIRYSASYVINENDEIIPEFIVPSNIPEEIVNTSGLEFIKNYLIRVNSIPNASSVIFNRKLLNSGIFHKIKDFKLNGDWMFWILLSMQSKIYYCATPLNKFRVHSQNVRNKESTNALLEYIRVAQFLDSIGYSAEVSDRLRYIFNNQKLILEEKRKIMFFFIKRKYFKHLFKLFANR
jgi:glycosyltransferase involved in cell wall biosynthesis